MKIKWEDYRVHYVAGYYLLVNVKQSGENYEAPIFINESGAAVCNFMIEGKDIDEAVAEFASLYDISKWQAKEDVLLFMETLNHDR